MQFGIFDHLDDSGVPLGRHFEDRLKLIEAYDRAGFYGYHLAEHHNTPLGYAPSPGVFLWAVARGAHIVTLRDTAAARAIIDLYKAEWSKHGRPDSDLPLMGINRHIVIADTQEAARDIARRAYRPWRRNMERLWAQYDVPFPVRASP